MNRVKDYAQFAICFAGLGYLALWPLTEQDGIMIALAPSHALRLSPGLHLVGMAASAFVILRLSMRLWRRRKTLAVARRDDGGASVSDRDRRPLGFRRPAPPPPLRWVRPRRHFGLRGTPH